MADILIYYQCCEFRNVLFLHLGGVKMAKCAVCGKGIHFGNNVSHSNRKSSRIWGSNIRSVNCKVNGATKRLHVCSRCLRSGAVERA